MTRFLCALVFVVGSGLAGAGQLEVKIHRLPEELAKKTVSLNPEYGVFGEVLVEGEEKLPLVIMLHGGGGTGLNIQRTVRGPVGPLKVIEGAGIKTLLVAPQAAKSPRDEGAKGGWVPADLDILMENLLKTLPVDRNRVYLTGTSMGGYGTYAWAGVSPQHFAAIAPMVGGLGALGPKDVTKDLDLWGRNLATLPMKAYYGGKDRVVPPDRGEMIMKAIKKAGGKKAEVIVFDDLGHDAARRAYKDTEFFRWLFAQRRGEEGK